MAGSRSTAPLNRSNCVLHRRSTFCFRDLWLRSTLTFPPTKIPRLEQSFLSKECSSRLTPQSFITRIVRDRFVGKSDTEEGHQSAGSIPILSFTAARIRCLQPRCHSSRSRTIFACAALLSEEFVYLSLAAEIEPEVRLSWRFESYPAGSRVPHFPHTPWDRRNLRFGRRVGVERPRPSIGDAR